MTGQESLRAALATLVLDPENDDPADFTDEQLLARTETLMGEGWHHAGKEMERANRYRDALIRVGGLNAEGFEGYHNVGDKEHPDECPGCWAWWGLFDTVRPTQEQLDELRAVEGIKGYV